MPSSHLLLRASQLRFVSFGICVEAGVFGETLPLVYAGLGYLRKAGVFGDTLPCVYASESNSLQVV